MFCMIVSYTSVLIPMLIVRFAEALPPLIFWQPFPPERGRFHGFMRLSSSTGALGPVDDSRTIFCPPPFFVKGLHLECGFAPFR